MKIYNFLKLYNFTQCNFKGAGFKKGIKKMQWSELVTNSIRHKTPTKTSNHICELTTELEEKNDVID